MLCVLSRVIGRRQGTMVGYDCRMGPILLTLLVLLSGAGVAAGQTPSPPPPSPVMVVPPDNMRVALVEAYRLRPDHRALLAIAEVHRLLTGQDRAAVAANFRDGRFHLTYRNLEVGALPEFPDFPDILDVLSRWVTVLHQPRTLSPAAGPATAAATSAGSEEPFFAAELVAALGRIDGEWRAGGRHPGLLRDATRALVRLALQQLRWTDDADIVEATALAALALARTLAGDAMSRDEALLASVLGYSAHAERLAASLPAADALRPYLLRDRQGLEAAATAPGAPVETRYLWLLRLAELKDLDAWRAWQRQGLEAVGWSVPILTAGLRFGTFEANASFAPLLPQQIARELASTLGKPAPTFDDPLPMKLLKVAAGSISLALYAIDQKIRGFLGLPRNRVSGVVLTANRFLADAVSRWSDDGMTSLIRPIETDVALLAARPGGPFLHADTLGAHYRDALYSGLAILGLHQLDARSAVRDVTALARRLTRAATRDGAAFVTWYQHLATFKAGEADLRLLLDDLAGGRHVGARLLERTFEEFRARASFGDPLLPAAARALAARLDTRAAHRFYLADVAYTGLLDLRLAEQLYGSVLAIAAPGEPSLRTWYAAFIGDAKALRAQVDSPALRPEQRAETLGLLEREGLIEAAALGKAYQRLLQEFPDDWKARAKYVDYLERTRAYGDARGIIQAWLDGHGDGDGFDVIFARTALARMYYHEGRYANGLAAVVPVVGSGQAGAMERAAMLLDRLGRATEAEQLARRVVSAYPDSVRSRALLAELSWRHGADDRAAQVLASGPHRLSSTDWLFTVAPRFADVFGEAPAERGLAAFGALLRQKFNHFDLQRLAFPLGKAGKNELAFAMVSQLRWGGLGQAEFWIDAYRYLRAWRGKDVAQEWLGKQIPPHMLAATSMIMYENGQYELLWDLIDRTDDFTWLMRASAALKQSPGPPQQKLLREHYTNPGGSYYHAAGRFLSGLIGERELLQLASDPKRRCELSYYVGLRAESEGRYAEASDWYRVSVETGLIKNGEYRWAHTRLTLWQEKGKNLARLAAARL